MPPINPKKQIIIFMVDILKSVNIDFRPPMPTWHQLDPDSAWARDSESAKTHCWGKCVNCNTFQQKPQIFING